MIPIGPISRYQHGQFSDSSVPKINLGSSLARVYSSLASASQSNTGNPAKTAQDRNKKIVRKVIAARRVSDVFLNLPKIADNANKTGMWNTIYMLLDIVLFDLK